MINDVMDAQRWLSAAITVKLAEQNAYKHDKHLMWKNFVVQRIVIDCIGGTIALRLSSSAISKLSFEEVIFNAKFCKSMVQFRSVFARYFNYPPESEDVKAFKKKHFDKFKHYEISDFMSSSKAVLATLI